MRAFLLRAIFGSVTLATIALPAQMHKVAKPQQVVRAVGVYEWTGDFAKPTASRLIPVSLYIEGKFEDAGIYIARPIPFALLPGNLYILQSAGIDKGTLDLAYAKHLQAVEPTGDLAFDDGWFGYGSVRPLSAPRRTTTALKPSKNLPVIATASGPHFGSKPADSTLHHRIHHDRPKQNRLILHIQHHQQRPRPSHHDPPHARHTKLRHIKLRNRHNNSLNDILHRQHSPR